MLTDLAPLLTEPADPFAALNDAQRAAVDHGAGPGPAAPLLVIAGAGTGKTRTLAARVARLVLAGADPNRILLLTFSRRAAREMTHRVGRTLHRALGLPATTPAPTLPWSGTFHGIGARLLREHASRIGLPDDFTVLDRADAEDLMAMARQALDLGEGAQRFPQKGTCVSMYSRVVNSRQALEPVVAQAYPWCLGWETELRRLFRAYVEAKQRQHLLDFDDLLLYWERMMAEPASAAAVGRCFDHVLVDEYQDTNRLQAAVLAALKPDGRGVTVVGDDAQSIYAFRAAEVRNILDFPAQFDPPARVVTLAHNYRSTQPILDAANAVMAAAAERHVKTLHSSLTGERPRLVTVADEAEQARWVADDVLRHREAGIALRRQAVLFRTGHHTTALELELARRDIPFVKYGGLQFLESAHVKDLLSILRWVQNPRHRLAGFRVAGLVPGIGPAGARRVVDAMVDADDPQSAMQAFKPPASARQDWPAWLQAHRAVAEAPWPEAIAVAWAWYRPQLQRLHEDADVRAADLDQLVRLAGGWRSRERFLAELTVDPPASSGDESGEPHRDEDYLVLSTMHSAKGQEWTSVRILNVVDGCMPADLSTGSAAEIEEERRLLHVAMTRAKRHLALVAPRHYHVTQQARWGDLRVGAVLSRFLHAGVLACCDRVDPVPDRGADDALGGTAAGPVIDVAAQVRGLF